MTTVELRLGEKCTIMQDQAVRDTKVMADRLAARTAGGSHWGSTGRGMVARYRPGQKQTGPPKGGGRMRMLGGDSTGEATGSAAAESISMAPALLELLPSHGRLPPSELVAEHPCPQPDV